MGLNRLRNNAGAPKKTTRIKLPEPLQEKVVKRKSWNSPIVRVATIQKMLINLDIEPRSLSIRDFDRSGNSGLRRFYGEKILPPLIEAGFAFTEKEAKEHAQRMKFSDEKIYPWQIRNARIYADPQMQKAALLWLRTKVKKSPDKITRRDFEKHELNGLLNTKFKGRVFDALYFAGIVKKEDEEEMRRRSEYKFKKGIRN
jgi:hypothetical protein